MKPSEAPSSPAPQAPVASSGAPRGRPCPLCGASRVYRSHRRGFTERLLALAGFKIRRCHACNVRFIRFGRSTILIADATRALRQLFLLALLLAGLAAVLAAVTWLTARHAASTPPEGAGQILWPETGGHATLWGPSGEPIGTQLI
jgi:hypothetical protein